MELINLISNVYHQIGEASVELSSKYDDCLKYIIRPKKFKRSIKELISLLNANINGKVFGIDEVFIEVTLPLDIDTMHISSGYYILLLPYKQVKIYLSEDVIPLDIIHLILITMDDNVSFINTLKSMNMKLSPQVYENFYKIKFPQDYPDVKYIVNKISVITRQTPWGSLYVDKLSSTETSHIRLALKIYNANPRLFDTFTDIFIEYHLGTTNDYYEWIEYTVDKVSPSDPIGTAIYLQDIKYHRHVDLMYDLIIGNTITTGAILNDWFITKFVPYLIDLQLKHKEIDYMKYLSHEVLLQYIRDIKTNILTPKLTLIRYYPIAVMEITKRDPEAALLIISEALKL